MAWPPRRWLIAAAGWLTLAGTVAGTVPGTVAGASELPVRWTSGASVWSTQQQAIDTFLRSGVITDRGLAEGLAGSGWSAEEIREALNKPYSVDLVAVARFLDSPAGLQTLNAQTSVYYPYRSEGRTGKAALRSAILADAADGQLSAANILANLPADMRRTPGPVTPLLTWLAFLPARIQAGQFSGRSLAGGSAAGAGVDPTGP
ncbi:MAG: alpha/beta hydrolase [Cyanobacteriota bacterium]|nr:alpha/beta hydrolase [Cyanobacteriota bacterium]